MIYLFISSCSVHYDLIMSAPEGASTSSVGGQNEEILVSPLADQGSDIYVDWKERCMLLEASLLKFKQQASKIRQLLSERVSTIKLMYAMYIL